MNDSTSAGEKGAHGTRLKRPLRFQFSLRTLMLLSVVVCVWLVWILPVQKQWKAVAPILDGGGTVETIPSNIPGASWLAGGDGGNIEAVFFNKQNATDETIEALRDLPHLRRLYMERTNLKPHHLDTIASLTQLKRLSIWGQNYKFGRSADLEKLAALKNLDVLDIKDTIHRYGNWKVLGKFRDLPNAQIKHNFTVRCPIGSADVQDLLPCARLLKLDGSLSIEELTGEQLKALFKCFPDLSHIEFVGDRPISKSFLNELLREKQERSLMVDPKSFAVVWKELGPLCHEIEIAQRTEYPHTNYLVFRGTHEGAVFEISMMAPDELSEFKTDLSELPDLSQVKSFKVCEYSGITALATKLPNVTELTSHCNGLFHAYSFGEMKKVEKIICTEHDTYLYPEELEAHCQKTFPNLREFEVLFHSHNGG